MLWKELNKIDQLEEIQLYSNQKPIAIFKHSTRCSISAAAKGRLERKWDDYFENEELDVYYLDLLRHRDISNAIAELYDIEHESPQFILINEGKAVYNASHFGINPEKISAVIHQP